MASLELGTAKIEDTEFYKGVKISIVRSENFYAKVTLSPIAEGEDPQTMFLIESELIDLHLAIVQFLELKSQERNAAEIAANSDEKGEGLW